MSPFSQPQLSIWIVLAVVGLTVIALCIRAEGRWFAARDKKAPWLILRICTIPIAISTAGLVIIVTRSVSGPEALAVFFVALFTLAPLVYFGMHWICGRWLQPRLTGGEIAWIGFSGLMIIAGPPAIASALHPWVFMAARVLF